MTGERQTVAGAYLKMAAHEELCAERYRGINEKLSWVLRSLVGMLLALLAWALVQLYALEPLREGAKRAAYAFDHTPNAAKSERLAMISNDRVCPIVAAMEERY